MSRLLHDAALPALAAILAAVFVFAALPRASGPAAVFAAAFPLLVYAAAAGPFGRLRGGVALGIGAAAACSLVATVRHGPLLAAALAGLFAGLFACACAAAGELLRAQLLRVIVAGLALALLFTLFFWDDAFLLRAADRKASAALACRLNPAASVADLVGFDWIHARALYTGNETAESLVGVTPLPLAGYAARLAGAGLLLMAAARWRKRRGR